MGNPFTENSSDLIKLDTRDIADPAIIERVCQIEKLGTEYELYVQEYLVEKTKNINEPIERNKLALFHCPPVKEYSLNYSSPRLRMTVLYFLTCTLRLK